MEFRWIQWNMDKAARHGVSVSEVEEVIEAAVQPFPEYRADDKWLVMGRTASGRYIQAVYLLDPDATVFVIHARPLTDREKRRLRRRRRRKGLT